METEKNNLIVKTTGLVLNIVSSYVQKGDFVNKGDTLLVIHALNMDNDILAPKDCYIEGVYVYKNAEIIINDVLFGISYSHGRIADE